MYATSEAEDYVRRTTGMDDRAAQPKLSEDFCKLKRATFHARKSKTGLVLAVAAAVRGNADLQLT